MMKSVARLLRTIAGCAMAAVLAVHAQAQSVPSRFHASFPPGAIWSQDISATVPDSNSATMITASVGWGPGPTSFQIDFSLETVYASWGGVQSYPLFQEAHYYLPDCDTDSPIPLPATGAIEGSTNYTCNLSNDCHLLVVDGDLLYESYQSTVETDGLNSLCLVKWHLNLVYPPEGRGEECTSADAAGFPMAPLIANADDVYTAMQVSGDLGHAIRFILPNPRMRSDGTGTTKYYVHPASHAGGPSGPIGAIPYGARLRLHSSFPISGYNAASQVLLRTLQKYGMFLSDGGSIPLTLEDDTFTTHKWSDVDINIDSHALFGIALTDFDVMPIGTPIEFTNETENCVRNGFGDDVIFASGLDW